MKKLLLLLLLVSGFGSFSMAKCWRFVDPRVYSRYFNEFAWAGFSVIDITDYTGRYINCTLSTTSTSDCPKCSGAYNGAGADPTDQTAAQYLFGQADLSAYDENFNITIYAAYQVSGEENLRHYKVAMSWTGDEADDVIQVFERID